MVLTRLAAMALVSMVLVALLSADYIVFDAGLGHGQDGSANGLFLPMISTSPKIEGNLRTPVPTTTAVSAQTATPNASRTPLPATSTTPSATTTQTSVQTSTPTAPPNQTATQVPGSAASPTPTPTTTQTTASTATPTNTPTPGSGTTTRSEKILVGPGYTDVSPKALIRTSSNRLYVGVSTCDAYPCVSTTQTIRMYRSDTTGIPTGFTRLDSSREPSGVAQWAIAVDGANVIHIAFNTRSTSGGPVTALKYATFDTSTGQWGTVETIDNAISFSQDSGGQGVQSVALALDAAGKPHVVYLAGTSRRLFYRNKTGAGWSNAIQVDNDVSYSGNLKAWHPNLAFDTVGHLIVAWQRGSFNGANDGTIYVKVRDTGGTWGGSLNLSGVNGARTIIDQSTSLMVTADNRYHITWITAPDDYIRYQYSDDNGATWQSNHPAAGVQVTHNPSLGPDGKGGIRLYGHGTPDPHPDGHGDNLYYFEGAGGAGVWSAFTHYVTGAFDSSVNTRWSQYFYNAPTVVDIAYWADPYPNILYVGSETVAP